MKLWTIFRFEFAYLVGRPSTWLYLIVLLGFTILMNLFITPGDGVYPNNTFHITAITVIGGLIWLLMGAATAGQAAARDVQMRMYPLTYTAPGSKLHYLGGRFLAAFAVNAGLTLSLPVGVLLSFYLPGMDQGLLLPFRPSAYLSVYFLIALPNTFVATALQFSFAALSQKVMASYLVSLLVAIFAQIIALAVAKLLGNWDLVKLLDPVGVAGIVGSELQTWTPVEKNTRIIMLEGMFLWNRVLWGSVAIGSLILTYLRFRFTQPVTKGGKIRFTWWKNVGATTAAETAVRNATAISVPQVHRSFGFATYLQQLITIAWASFKIIARHPVGLTLVGAAALVSVMFGNQIMTPFGIPLLPTTAQVLTYLTAPVGNSTTPWVVIPLLILYFAGELVWRDRDAGLRDLTDASPVQEWVLFTGKFLGLGLIIGVWMAWLMAAGIGMQVGMGYHKVEIGLYVQVLFGLQLIDYLLFALLALVVHIVVNQKYSGYVVVLLVLGFIAFPATFGVEHPMLIFGKDPGWWYTDMRGFGPTLVPWLWFKLYWIAWALLLAVAARLLWARGREQNLKYRLRLAGHRLSGLTTWVAIIAAGLISTLGSFIFYNTNVLNEYLTSADMNERKAQYERRYGQYRNTPQPQLVATKLQVEIYPDQQQVEIRAVYTLVNTDSVSIDSIHISSNWGIEPSEVNFSRKAAGVQIDKELHYQIYALKQPLQPGDSLLINFAVHYKGRAFAHSGTSALVVDNGTYFTNYDLLPAIGYQRYREMNDAVLRKKYRLAARPELPSLYDREARNKPLSRDQAAFEAIVGTAKEEVAVAPGRLLNSWTVGGRRYFHYKTDAPIGGEYALLSAKYAVRESTWKDVAVRVYYHPGHAATIDRLLRSINASLAYFTRQFGPYPYSHLTVVERAGSGGGASADASMINYGEVYSLMNPDEGPDGFDLPYYILAHEVAHQWWGLARLTPANVEGAGVLIEGLAVYSGMQVLEESYGDTHLRQYVDLLHSSYEMPRSLATASLLEANESFLYYRKGGIAMYALSKYLGKEKVNGALRSLLQKRTTGVLPLPTTLDLYGELQQITPDSLHYLLDDLFKLNTYWRLKTKQFALEQTDGGNWQVTLKVQAQKVVVDRTGYEKQVPMNDWLEVGIYEEGKGLDEPLYLRMHRIQSGEQTIQVIVPRKPQRGGIDPNHLMIDLRLDDNMRQLDGEAG
ncbi:ABC transporter permease [Rhodocytophaga aerolata]|uniref:ABC transporter permease n=1 Tax=Rhodocytophaga aerolata TaxID=455078 RepID=A0ABT8RGG1_9BACT|nr:ABC transporter permease [Rhodocytophaga aerolata]MDO1450791.1 ABC transporter permease [Rhodocytophaga aerolata]